MNRNQSARLDRTKFFADPVLVVTVFLLIVSHFRDAPEAYDTGENSMFDVVLDSGIKNESGANGNIGGKSGVISVGISFPGN